jgi:Asp-tRNA(Asn)/Glu-tRNA(Gln) amidotransferase C subunit
VSSYEFGIICVDASGVRKKHTFGRGSFDAVETFDTLAQCSKCLGLDDERVVAQRLQKKQWKHSAEVSEVASLSEEVKTLTEGLSGMLGVLKKLQQKVDANHATTASPSVVATAAAWSGEVSDDSVVGNLTRGDVAANQSSPLLRGGLRSKDYYSQPPQQVKVQAQLHHKVRHHRHHRHHKDEVHKRVKVHEVQHRMKIPGAEDIESVSTSLETLDQMDAEASELEVASAGAASERFGENTVEVGQLDDGSMSLDKPWYERE